MIIRKYDMKIIQYENITVILYYYMTMILYDYMRFDIKNARQRFRRIRDETLAGLDPWPVTTHNSKSVFSFSSP